MKFQYPPQQKPRGVLGSAIFIVPSTCVGRIKRYYKEEFIYLFNLDSLGCTYVRMCNDHQLQANFKVHKIMEKHLLNCQF